MKTSKLLKTLTVAGAVAMTLTLSACDMHVTFSPESQEQDGQQAQTEDTEMTAEEPTTDTGSTTDSATDGSTGATDTSTTDAGTTSSGGSTDSGSTTSASDSGSSSNGSSSTGSTGNDGYQGPRIGEEGVELDADGYGKIPADVLEKDIKNAYAKQGTTVDTVDCYADLRIRSSRGSQSCTVTAVGKNHYGTVKITSASQSGISYSLEFPNI
ncbi:hypothetical protein [Brevibacterium sp. FAM 24638]|uniref:hypothetical protein n=1 Tax=Brevibacterium sp. FAM 24638 TaxID=3415681 RepID=UPI003C7A709F